jgi:3-methyladenine DNA glycosylase/8-oxoguanine DNA glycosylase
MRQIVACYGTPVPGLRALGLTHTFPSAAELARADLRGLGLGPALSSAIRAVAQAVADRTLNLDPGNGLDGLVESVTAIRGVSPQAAQYLALRLGERHAFPATSPVLLRSLSHATRQAVTPMRAAAIADRWRPWRAHAATHLWIGDQALSG